MLDPDLLELMPFTCTLKPPLERNLHGERTFGDALTPAPQCRVEVTGRQTYSNGVVTVFRDGIVFLDGVYPVTEDWFLSIPSPGSVTEVEVDIVAIDQLTDEEGWHSTVLHYGAK